jgi:copper chaperone CopZ
MKASLEIQNLKCHGCANTITAKLADLNGVSVVKVDNDTDSVDFEYQSKEGLDQAITLLSKLGYPVSGERNPLTKKAKSYVSCAIGRMNN